MNPIHVQIQQSYNIMKRCLICSLVKASTRKWSINFSASLDSTRQKHWMIHYHIPESMTSKAKGPWKHLRQLGKIIPWFIEIVASYATISSWYGCGEGNIVNATTRMSIVEGFMKFHHLFWSFRPCIDEFQYCKPSLSRWNMVVQ